MASLHFRLQYNSGNYLRIRKLNDEDIASLPADLPDDQPPPAPVSDADVRITLYDSADQAIVGWTDLLLAPYGDPAFASYKTYIADVTLDPGHYAAIVTATRLDGKIVRRAALVSVSDD